MPRAENEIKKELDLLGRCRKVLILMVNAFKEKRWTDFDKTIIALGNLLKREEVIDFEVRKVTLNPGGYGVGPAGGLTRNAPSSIDVTHLKLLGHKEGTLQRSLQNIYENIWMRMESFGSAVNGVLVPENVRQKNLARAKRDLAIDIKEAAQIVIDKIKGLNAELKSFR